MRQRALPQFEVERARFGLRFTCEYCMYFNPANERCTHGYPNTEHRERVAVEQPASVIVFCKEFELR